jgi:dTDP-4-amino-4,6-dideoxygalactose transaminase
MRTLALQGGKPIVREPIKPLVTMPHSAIMKAISQAPLPTLSGYLAGSERGGVAVQRLEDLWAREFKVGHAIACNSGTSALLAACAAARCQSGTRVITPTTGMSAAAAAPRLLGSTIVFKDIDDWFCLAPEPGMVRTGDVAIAISMFGHPAQLRQLKAQCEHNGAILIEDACQSPWATENGQLCGTIGDLGCFSFNCHKAINAGEGGMVVTNSDLLAQRVRAFINHGECSTHAYDMVGLNLRMTEPTAVLILAQIESGRAVVERRREIAYRLFDEIEESGPFGWFNERDHCDSSWYAFPILAPSKAVASWAALALQAEGVPCRHGYTLMHRLPYFVQTYGNQTLPKAESFNDRMILIELTSIDPTNAQIKQTAAALNEIAAAVE